MPHITQSATVVVPVGDQDQAVDFYTRVLGFEKRLDFTYDTGERWVEVVPPAASRPGTALYPSPSSTGRSCPSRAPKD
jgi:catechol 2,3-dioxygenase-like lactoylglutathione lyase family enzyme